MKALKKHLPLLMAFGGSLIYISLIFNNNLWMDEAFSAVLVRGSFSEMLDRSLSDTLPPLYNILAWGMTQVFGYNTLVLKLTSVLPMIALLFFAFSKLPKLYGAKTACFFILCTSAMPHFLHYGVEIRMYSLCLAFTSMAGICALDFYKKQELKSGIFLALFSALSAYSHHYGILALAFVWIYLFIYFFLKKRPDLKKWGISALLTALLCLPYVMITILQIKNSTSYFSTGTDPAGGFFAALRYPFVTEFTPLSALLLLSVILLCIFGNRLKEGYALMSVYVLVLLLSYGLMMITGKVFFSGRYLLPAFGLFWLGFSILIPKTKKAFCLIYALLILAVGSVCYARQFKEEYKPGISQMLAFFDENLSPDDGYIIFEDNYEIEWCMRYYEPDLKKYPPENIESIRGRIWYFCVPGYENMLDESIRDDYNIVYKDSMSFDRYSFDLYELVVR